MLTVSLYLHVLFTILVRVHGGVLLSKVGSGTRKRESESDQDTTMINYPDNVSYFDLIVLFANTIKLVYFII